MHLTLRNDLRELRRMSAWLDSTCAALAINETLRFNLDLCANEAVTNIISYAFADAGEHQIGVRLHCDAQRIVIEFEDDGEAFDPLAGEQGPAATRLDDAAIGGWGLLLIRRLLPDSHYERRQGRNLLRLSARRDAFADSSSST